MPNGARASGLSRAPRRVQRHGIYSRDVFSVFRASGSFRPKADISHPARTSFQRTAWTAVSQHCLEGQARLDGIPWARALRPSACLSRVHILRPDRWPEFVQSLARRSRLKSTQQSEFVHLGPDDKGGSLLRTSNAPCGTAGAFEYSQWPSRCLLGTVMDSRTPLFGRTP